MPGSPPPSTATATNTPHPAPAAAGRGWRGLVFALLGRCLVSPRLALDLMRLAWAFRREGWWRRPPFFPVPDRVYLRWRMYTAYADPDAVPPVEDVVAFARWRRETMGM